MVVAQKKAVKKPVKKAPKAKAGAPGKKRTWLGLAGAAIIGVGAIAAVPQPAACQ